MGRISWVDFQGAGENVKSGSRIFLDLCVVKFTIVYCGTLPEISFLVGQYFYNKREDVLKLAKFDFSLQLSR